MEPNFKENDYLIISKFSYLIKIPKVGDVVILKHPINNELIIKRISDIKNNSYFVTGDNKNSSVDSKDFGFVNKRLVIGKVWKRITK